MSVKAVAGGSCSPSAWQRNGDRAVFMTAQDSVVRRVLTTHRVVVCGPVRPEAVALRSSRCGDSEVRCAPASRPAAWDAAAIRSDWFADRLAHNTEPLN